MRGREAFAQRCVGALARQVMVWNACDGNDVANALTLMGCRASCVFVAKRASSGTAGLGTAFRIRSPIFGQVQPPGYGASQKTQLSVSFGFRLLAVSRLRGTSPSLAGKPVKYWHDETTDLCHGSRPKGGQRGGRSSPIFAVSRLQYARVLF